MKRKSYLVALLVLIFAGMLRADEGMWLLQLIKQQNAIELMKKQGLQLEAEDLYNPGGVSLKDAVGIFGGGCTGEIISPEGLILTNHHCGYGAIQQHSSVEHDYLTDGFWAMSQQEELPTPGLRFTFITRIEEITDLVNLKIKNGEVDEYTAQTRPFLADLAEELFEKSDLYDKPGVEVQALPFYAGNRFYLFYRTVYTDVRMVAAPPSSVGKFGGETDNWMWPRHTGDFSMFRIYADANGEPADYAPTNVPLKTPKYLSISIKGLEEGDYAMIMGFPGSTYRYLTTAEVQSRMEAQNEPRIIIRGAALEVLRQAMTASDKTRIQYASKSASISNYWKNSIGMNEAIVDNNVLGVKAEQERNYEAFAQGKPEYEGVVKKLNDIITAEMPYRRQAYFMSEAFGNVIEFIRRDVSVVELTNALEAKDEVGIKKGLERLQRAYTSIHNKDYDHEVDRSVAKAVLPVYAANIPAEQRPSFYQTIDKEFKGNIDAYVDALYDKSILANEANLNKFVKKPTLKALQKDLMLQLMNSTAAKTIELTKALAENTKEIALLHKAYIRGLGEMKLPTPSYPDANFTIRLTYGNVKPYQPRDGVTYKYYTTTDGVLEKEDPTNREFNVPAKLKQLIQSKDFGRYAMKNGEMPVCFLSTNDITGGNSGSPVLSAHGELIGAAFDGNWESLSGDISFNKELQRCINVDIRYILFIIDKLGNCQRLINEMTIVE
ncbi:MAG: S46 family peptidase [Prevotellaceae bacterium]|nr:S46 family peptidase [Prevotellaceae bacterium]